MKSRRLFYLIVFIPILSLFACSGKTDETERNNLTGNWIGPVADGAFIGNDTLHLAPDSTFKECKGLVYTASDSGFDFSIGINIGIAGHWSLKEDSLMVVYDPKTLHISTDKNTFRVSATDNNANANSCRECVTICTMILTHIYPEFWSLNILLCLARSW